MKTGSVKPPTEENYIRLMRLKLKEREDSFAVHMGALVQEVKQGMRGAKHQVEHKLGTHKDCEQHDASVDDNGKATQAAAGAPVAQKPNADTAPSEMRAVGATGWWRL